MGSSVGIDVSVVSTFVGEGSTLSTTAGDSEEGAQLAQNWISTKIVIKDLIHGRFTLNFPFYSYSGNLPDDTMDKGVV